jgi:hypothetical protein
VATYTVMNVAWGNSLRDGSIIEQKEEGLYGIVNNSAFVEMPVGKNISVQMMYNLESDEGNFNISASTELRII